MDPFCNTAKILKHYQKIEGQLSQIGIVANSREFLLCFVLPLGSSVRNFTPNGGMAQEAE